MADEFTALLTALDPADRRKWAVCVAVRAVERLPASRRKAQLRWLLDRAFPPAGAALPPDGQAVCFARANDLVQAGGDTDHGPATWGTLVVLWALAADAAGTLPVDTSVLVGNNAAILAGTLCGVAGGVWLDGYTAERAWQIARALEYSPANTGRRPA